MSDDAEFPTETPNKWLANPKTRRWLYGIAVAVGALLVVLNVATAGQVDAVVNVIGYALLISASGLAGTNTPK